MLIFADTAEIDQLRPLVANHQIDGVTTNPSLIAKSGRPFHEVILEICELVKGPVSAEVVSETAEEMIEEGRKLAAIHEHVVVKLPLTVAGLAACHVLTEEDIHTNVTLCFSVNQAILAARAGATFVSPFIGRVDDVNADGAQLIDDICQVYEAQGFETMVLAASIRTVNHVTQAAMAGAQAATMPAKLINAMAAHPLTDKGLEIFKRDWEAALPK